MKSKIIGWNFLKNLGNLTFSIILLLIISFISIIGTVIEQDRSLEYYREKYPLNSKGIFMLNWESIEYWNLNHIYTSWLFLTLLTLFSLSLIICTFSNKLQTLKNARQWKFKKNISIQKQLYSQKYQSFCSFSSIVYYLNKEEYYIFYQKNYLYAYTGLQGKLAPIFVHLSILVLLVGSVTSLLTSFSVQEMIPSGEMFNMQNIINSGSVSRIPSYINGSVNDFYIDYYEDKSIKQFYSLITMQSHKDQQIKTERISVNHPLYFKGLTIYQTDWQINGLRININDTEYIQIPLRKINNNNQVYWFANIKYNNRDNYSFILSNIDGIISCYDNQGQLLHLLEIQERNIINHVPITIISILTSTGLQIKQDLGVNLIYLSFLFLMLSIITSYLSYSQIWLTLEKSILKISGHTNRAEINFEEDMYKFKRFLC